jgi:hypothetical protein
MKLIETTVSGSSVWMRFADNADAARAAQWIDFQVPLAALKHGSGTDLPDPVELMLAATQVAALRFVRDRVSEETQRLASLANRNS